MDSQRIPADLASGQKMPMGPAVNPQNQLPNAVGGPRLAGPVAGAGSNNFPGSTGVAGPRAPVQPGQPQQAFPRPGFAGAPQRAPPPRAPGFLGPRPAQPGAPIPGGPPPARFPQGPPGQPVLQPPPRPLQPGFPPQQQGFPNRAPFPGGESPLRPPGPPLVRPPPPPLQRNDSIVNTPADPRLVRPALPPDPRLQQQQQQAQPGDRRVQFRPQMSVERIMTEAEINQQRPPSSASILMPPASRSEDKTGTIEEKDQEEEKKAKLIAESRNDQESKGQRLEQKPNNVANGSEHKSIAEAKSQPPSSEVKPVPAATGQQKAKSDDSESIKGFDNGRRKSLASPEPDAGPAKKKTSFADQPATVHTPDSDSPTKSLARTMKKSPSAMRSIKADAENDSGVDESTQRREGPKSNGVADTPTKKSERKSAVGSPVKSPSKSIKSLPKTPDAAPSTAQDKKKVPMNKVQVGAAPSPNLKAVRSKIGSLNNATYKPGGGNIKIENRKLDFSKAQPKIAAKNDKYTPSGGDKKIQQQKLQWNAKPKIGSLDNAAYKPGGGDKKIETVKLDFKEKAKPKVGSKENAKHVPGGGSVKSPLTPPKTPQDITNNIETQKIDIKAESKIGSMDNVKHKPGGGDKKIFDDKSYLRQTSSNVGSVSGSGSQSPIPSGAGSISGEKNGLEQEC